MLAIERRSRILEFIQQEQSVIVSDLSKRYNVTEETIRRDLEKLEKDGFVKKTYGGAVYADGINKDLPFRIRERSNKNAKMLIAKKVADLVGDGDAIMMDSSSTSMECLKLLKQKENITIITNSAEALIELFDAKNITVISTGGVVRGQSLSLIGKNAEEMIEKYNVDKAIISCKGIDMEKGVTDSNEHEVVIKRAMLKAAKQKILAADGTKFGKAAFTKLIDVSEIDVLVTDFQVDEQWSAFFENNKIKVY